MATVGEWDPADLPADLRASKRRSRRLSAHSARKSLHSLRSDVNAVSCIIWSLTPVLRPARAFQELSKDVKRDKPCPRQTIVIHASCQSVHFGVTCTYNQHMSRKWLKRNQRSKNLEGWGLDASNNHRTNSCQRHQYSPRIGPNVHDPRFLVVKILTVQLGGRA